MLDGFSLRSLSVIYIYLQHFGRKAIGIDTKMFRQVRFRIPEDGTELGCAKAHIKSPKGSQSRPRKGPKMPPCQADFRGDGADLTLQVLLDAKLSDEGAFPSPRGRDGF